MVRTKNVPTKQIVGGSPDSHLVEAMGVERISVRYACSSHVTKRSIQATFQTQSSTLETMSALV